MANVRLGAQRAHEPAQRATVPWHAGKCDYYNCFEMAESHQLTKPRAVDAMKGALLDSWWKGKQALVIMPLSEAADERKSSHPLASGGR